MKKKCLLLSTFCTFQPPLPIANQLCNGAPFLKAKDCVNSNKEVLRFYMEWVPAEVLPQTVQVCFLFHLVSFSIVVSFILSSSNFEFWSVSGLNFFIPTIVSSLFRFLYDSFCFEIVLFWNWHHACKENCDSEKQCKKISTPAKERTGHEHGLSVLLILALHRHHHCCGCLVFCHQ